VRLVVITQAVDPDDPALGATVDKLRALAARVDEVVVLALRVRPAGLPPNVRVRSFDARGPALKAARLLAALVPELRRRPVAVLAHMAPAYALVAAPVTRPFRIPLLLWFTHWRASQLLELAERVSTRVLSVNERSFPLRSSKLVATGHGVEVPEQAIVHGDNNETLRLLALGRTSPAKGLETLVEAVALTGDLPVTAEIRGPSLTAEEHEHRAALAARIARDGLGRRVVVDGPVERSRVHSLYERSDALVNNMRAGALDKVVFEAAGAGLPVLVASDGFAPLVDGLDTPLRFRQDDAADLADRIRALHQLGAAGRAALGATLRARVQAEHSVEHWADEVVAAAR
jgi:glycosyltransferase involved in cell wall biosynthesis